MTGVTYESLASEITRKYEERERQIDAMQRVANAMCHEVIRQLNVPSGRFRIGALAADESFVAYAWDIKNDGSMGFTYQLDYLDEDGDLIVQHHASFKAKEEGGNVNLTSLESKGGALVNYAPVINEEHLKQAAQLATFVFKLRADKFRG